MPSRSLYVPASWIHLGSFLSAGVIRDTSKSGKKFTKGCVQSQQDVSETCEPKNYLLCRW